MNQTHALGDGAWYFDLHYQGQERLIATAVLETDAGLLVIDPGPTPSLPSVHAALGARGCRLHDVHALLLTHIHLDHSGGAGALVAEHPGLQVYVHRLGAPHLNDPARLLASARRLYGDQMDTLWGEILPVPEANLHVLRGGEMLTFGGRTLEVAYTPGHAVHHVSYYDPRTDIAFVGDTAGMRVTGTGEVLPVTPPPDVDLKRWPDSLATLRAWDPAQLFLTHFGPADGVSDHLERFENTLSAFRDRVAADLDAGVDEEPAARRMHKEVLDDLRQRLSKADARPYELFGYPSASWHGLARFLRKQTRPDSPQ